MIKMEAQQLMSETSGEYWGLLTALDLHGCNPETIRDAEKIKQYVKELCELLNLKRFGETIVVHFGDEPRIEGFSMTQLIETSLISGHFANKTNAAYIDIFGCGDYDPKIAAEFTKKFFESKDMNVHITERK